MGTLELFQEFRVPSSVSEHAAAREILTEISGTLITASAGCTDSTDSGDHALGAVSVKYRAIEYVLPSRAVDNDEVIQNVLRASEKYLSSSDRKYLLRSLRLTFQNVGTQLRYRRAEGERASDLAAQAGRQALASAAMEADEIDLLIYVGVGRGFLEPATANVFQDLLGLVNATSFDVLDACASWLRAVHIAQSFLATKSYRKIMILNAEFNADFEHYELRALKEFEYRFPAFTIGEGASATIVTESEENDLYRAEFRTFGDQREKCIIPLENYRDYLAMDDMDLPSNQFISYGRELMDFGLAKLLEHYQDRPDFQAFDPDIVFFHAASDGMSRAGMRESGLDIDKGYYAHSRFGNTVSASIPMAMSEARREGRLSEGMKVLVSIASAGVSTGLCRFRFLS